MGYSFLRDIYSLLNEKGAGYYELDDNTYIRVMYHSNYSRYSRLWDRRDRIGFDTWRRNVRY